MTTLNNSQYHAYNNAQQLLRFLNKKNSICATVMPFNNTFTSFKQNLAQVSVEASVKQKKGTSITTQKRELKKTIAREGAQICSLATAFAVETNNTTLLQAVNYTYTDLYTLKDVLLHGVITTIVQEIKSLLKKNDFCDYGVTAENLASILNKAEAFHNTLGEAKMINFGSNAASRNITALLKKIKGNIAQFKRLLPLFKEKHPDFIIGFHKANATNEPYMSYNAIEGIIKDEDTGQPIENVTITAEGRNKTTTTSTTGFYYLKGIKTGTHTLTVVADGYPPQTVIVKILRGKTITLNISLLSKHLIPANADVA